MSKDELVKKFKPIVEITYYYSPELTEFYANKCATIAQEYADVKSKERSIGFAKWIKEEWSISKGYYRHRGDFYHNDKKRYTEEDLYDIYIKFH